jgi:hypothetical protein
MALNIELKLISPFFFFFFYFFKVAKRKVEIAHAIPFLVLWFQSDCLLSVMLKQKLPF